MHPLKGRGTPSPGGGSLEGAQDPQKPMTPEEQDRPNRADGAEIAIFSRTTPTASHDEVILRAAHTAAREIRLERRARYARFGLWAAVAMATLALVLITR